MSTPEAKFIQSQNRMNQALRKVFEPNPEFTGQIDFEVHCKDGVVMDVYEITRRRKI